MYSNSHHDDYYANAEVILPRNIADYRQALEQDIAQPSTDTYADMYDFNDFDCVCEDVSYYNFAPEEIKSAIEREFAHHDKTFSERVLEIIREKELNEIAVYKRAHLDRKLFSKLRSNIYYKPSRSTAIALALALELNLDEACILLKSAGFALSGATLEDIIIEYFFVHRIYSILALNEMLYSFKLPLLL